MHHRAPPAPPVTRDDETADDRRTRRPDERSAARSGGCRVGSGARSETFSSCEIPRAIETTRRRATPPNLRGHEEEWRAPPDTERAPTMASTAAHACPSSRDVSSASARASSRAPARSVAARVSAARGTCQMTRCRATSRRRRRRRGARPHRGARARPHPTRPRLFRTRSRRRHGAHARPRHRPRVPGRWSSILFAFLGDAVWELYVRRAFFAPPRVHSITTSSVSAPSGEAQTSSPTSHRTRLFTGTRANPNPNPNCNPDQPRNDALR